MQKNLFLYVLLSALLTLTLAAGASAGASITVANSSDIVDLDPQGQNDVPSARVRAQVYETLVFQDTELNLVPGLAVSWEQVDETTFEFALREGVTFHNGEPFTANDVKFTLTRHLDPENNSPTQFLVGFVDDVIVLDDYRVQITMNEPFAPALSHLAHPATSILNEKAVTEAGEDYGTQVAVGTGPFRFLNWSIGSHVDLARFDDYWGEVAKAERLRFRGIPENTVRAIELETGGVDIAYGIAPMDELILEANPLVVLDKVETLATHYVGFNAQKEPFDNVLVRQAINHAIDVEAVVDFIYTGQAVRAASPISSRVWGANTELEPYEFNPELARELLAEAGYPDGFSTTLWTNDNPLRMEIAEMAQANLAEIGIDVEIQILTWGTYLEDTAAGRHDMFILAWSTVTGDADYGLYPLFHSSQYGNPGNRTFWSHPRVDELLDLARLTADPDTRQAAYWEAQEIIRDEAPWIFLISTLEVNGLRNNITGFEAHPALHHKLRSVTRVE